MSTIVIVDDQPVNRTIYAEIASPIEDDVCTRTFGDPREALEALGDCARSDNYRLPDARPKWRVVYTPRARRAGLA